MKFSKCFYENDAIPLTGIENANNLMKKGALYRYNHFSSEREKVMSELAKLENEFANYIGHNYVIGVNSCGSALFLALKAAGLQHGEKVFTNSFTFTAVPSSIIHAGGVPVYIECDNGYVIDINDFEKKIAENPEVNYFLLSYMRGYVADLDKIQTICQQHNIYLIEDCAHSLGVSWYDNILKQEKQVGYHGEITCFSTQSYKLLNSGEGGFIATNSPEIAAYCIVASGAYENLYQQHLSLPIDESIFDKLTLEVPNFSMRMSNLTAAILRPQILLIDEKIVRYRKNYQQLARILSHLDYVKIPQSHANVSVVGDSFQFNLATLEIAKIQEFIKNITDKGINIQLFGHKNNARYFKNWQYSFEEVPELKQTEVIISTACDMRLPLLFTAEDINLIGYLIKDNLYKVLKKSKQADYKAGLTDRFTSINQVISTYDDWAAEYNQEHQDNGWQILLNHTAYILTQYLNTQQNVLDVGCGTGLLGSELHSYGFDKVSGIDISENSLELASQLDIYENLQQEELGKNLDFIDNSFDALVSCGVFTRKQIPLNAFEELLRILKPKGLLAVVLRVEDEGYYELKIQQYCTEKKLQEVFRERLYVLQSCCHDLLILQKEG